LIKLLLPEHGERRPFLIWGIYAALGCSCAVAMEIFARVTAKRPAAP
jgi:hypothetical protein